MSWSSVTYSTVLEGTWPGLPEKPSVDLRKFGLNVWVRKKQYDQKKMKLSRKNVSFLLLVGQQGLLNLFNDKVP